jgi:hypothetical protein
VLELPAAKDAGDVVEKPPCGSAGRFTGIDTFLDDSLG